MYKHTWTNTYMDEHTGEINYRGLELKNTISQ